MLGRLKFYLQRVVTYIQIAQFFMVLKLFLKESRIHPLWLVACIPVWLVITWIDMKFVLSGELAEGWRKNPEWMEIKKELK